MTTSEQITRLQTARNTLRNKGVDLGIATTSAKLDELATAFSGIENKGAVSATVQEGDTYTIPKGYHNGSGTVSGVKGDGNYSLQSKSITPTKAQQNVTPDSGYYGLSDVTVASIPEIYHDVSSVDATAADVLANRVFVDADGKVTPGTMPNNGAVNKTLTAADPSYTVPKGYHNGSGKVQIVTEAKTATPTKEAQEITPSSGKVLSGVTVNAIPDEYQDVTPVTATAPNVLAGDVFVDAEGNEVTGTMPNNGETGTHLDGNTTFYTIPAGYTSGGEVNITAQTRTVTPTKSEQTITPPFGAVYKQLTVNAIPDAYQDVTGVTTVAAHVLDGDIFVDSTGAQVEGTMPNNGAISESIDGLTVTSYSVPAGYTSGGTVSLTDDIEQALAAI